MKQPQPTLSAVPSKSWFIQGMGDPPSWADVPDQPTVRTGGFPSPGLGQPKNLWTA